ncbi:MAG: tripartite tricarboxylate transporter substrate binding protein [Spirochaetia bacterium]|jgi:putative tricarboxylic transport membrane protein|nr:tripartite tricarboxylate transporter substrate binding protein [Spirochaetia bacterium]
MYKKILTVVAVALLALPVFANGDSEQKTGGTFVPTQNIEWYCTSSPGGGSDIFTRTIQDIMTSEKLVNGQNIIIQYKTDGAGEVGRALVSTLKGTKADYTLLTFNSGDLMPMDKNTDRRFSDFQPIAHMAVDNHLIFVTPDSRFKSFKDVLAALQNGDNVVMAGSKGDDIACHAALIKELGVSADQFAFIANDSSGTAVTSILGNHVDLLICKPAAASQYVEAGRLIPILALASKRFPGNLQSAPILSELGYHDVEVPNWRSVVGSKNMSPEAVAYWTDVFKKVSQTSAWQDGYINKQKLVADYMDSVTFKTYGSKFEADYLASIGK